MSRRRPIIVTAASLIALGACGDQVAAFRATFGESVTVPRRASARRALASRVAEARLDCGWYARRVLSPPALRAYDEARATARRAYDEATAMALRAYDEATAPAQRAHNEARATAWRAYQEATATAWRAYDEATATARRAYQEAKAPALLDGLVADADRGTP